MDNNELTEELEIRETVDGVYAGGGAAQGTASGAPAGAPAAGAKSTASKGRAKSEEAKVAALHKKRGRPDPYIWGIYIAILMISVVELFSASSTEVSGSNVYGPLIRHGMFLVMGFGIVL